MKRSIKNLFYLLLITNLVACAGGGSSGGSSPPHSSTMPAASSSALVSSSSSNPSSSSYAASSSLPAIAECSFGDSAVTVSATSANRVEAENYDTCVTSYADATSGNSGGVYRQQDVDIAADTGSSNGHHVTDIVTDEYLEYSLVVEKSGFYTITYRARPAVDVSAAPAIFLIASGGNNIESTRTSINPNGNGEWIDSLVPLVYLIDGPQTFRLQAIAGGASLDYIELAYTEDLIAMPFDAVAAMGIGINLGNTLDAPSEGAWAPSAQEAYFVAFKEAGFNHVRIPATWNNHTAQSSPYAVTSERMDRMEQVVDWALAQGYYVIINAHHEAWLKESYTTANKNRFDAIWTQIAERFKNKSSRLVFEMLNEPFGLTMAQVNELNLRILAIIRANNPTRLVVFAGNDYTGIATLLNVAVPDDSYLIGNFHSYDPWSFAGQCTRRWGTQEDINSLAAIYQNAKNWSVQHNIPVTVNEFGVAHYDFTAPENICNETDRLQYLQTHVNLAIQHGLAGTVWDDSGSFGIYNRANNTWGPEKDILTGANP